MEKKVKIPIGQREYNQFGHEEFEKCLDQMSHIYMESDYSDFDIIIWDFLVRKLPTFRDTGKGLSFSLGSQCNADRRRSREDLYLLLKPIIPEVTFKFCNDLLQWISQNWKYESPSALGSKRNVMCGSYCGQVKRLVFHWMYADHPSLNTETFEEFAKVIASFPSIEKVKNLNHGKELVSNES